MEPIHVLWDATNWGEQITMQLDQPFAWQHVNLQHIHNANLCEIMQPNTILLARPLSL